MIIVLGTYEELVLGYELSQNKDDSKYKLDLKFTDHSHIGCIKACSISTRGILATGSSDESIKLFNLNKKVEIGTLMQHDGAITQLHFHDKTHMFSSSEDGTICIWQVGKWECLKMLKGHKGNVLCFSVHPSGKLALSCGKDKSLRTWNLMTGKTAYISNLKEVIELILWFPASDKYVTCIGKKVDIYSIQTNGVIYTFNTDFRIACAVFLKSEILVLSGDGGDVIFYDIEKEETIHTIKTNTCRIKDMTLIEDEGNIKLSTASSDGMLNVYDIQANVNIIEMITYSSKLIASVNTKFRLICISAMKDKKKNLPDMPVTKKILISEEMGGASSDEDELEGDDDDELEEVNDDDLEGDDDDELEEVNDDELEEEDDDELEEVNDISSDEVEDEVPIKAKRVKYTKSCKNTEKKKSNIKSLKNKHK